MNRKKNQRRKRRKSWNENKRRTEDEDDNNKLNKRFDKDFGQFLTLLIEYETLFIIWMISLKIQKMKDLEEV